MRGRSDDVKFASTGSSRHLAHSLCERRRECAVKASGPTSFSPRRLRRQCENAGTATLHDEPAMTTGYGKRGADLVAAALDELRVAKDSLQLNGFRPKRIFAFDFDCTITREHLWKNYQNSPLDMIHIREDTFVNLDAFKEFVTTVLDSGHTVAVATFGRRDVVDKALTCAFGKSHGFIISTPADHFDPSSPSIPGKPRPMCAEGCAALGDKNTQLASLAARCGVSASSITFFDDDAHNVRMAARAGVCAIHTPAGLTGDVLKKVSKSLLAVPGEKAYRKQRFRPSRSPRASPPGLSDTKVSSLRLGPSLSPDWTTGQGPVYTRKCLSHHHSPPPAVRHQTPHPLTHDPRHQTPRPLLSDRPRIRLDPPSTSHPLTSEWFCSVSPATRASGRDSPPPAASSSRPMWRTHGNKRAAKSTSPGKGIFSPRNEIRLGSAVLSSPWPAALSAGVCQETKTLPPTVNQDVTRPRTASATFARDIKVLSVSASKESAKHDRRTASRSAEIKEGCPRSVSAPDLEPLLSAHTGDSAGDTAGNFADNIPENFADDIPLPTSDESAAGQMSVPAGSASCAHETEHSQDSLLHFTSLDSITAMIEASASQIALLKEAVQAMEHVSRLSVEQQSEQLAGCAK